MSAPQPRPPSPEGFRWQALFQRSDEALFLLDRRRRILFVNAAWEALAGVSAADARNIVCRRQRPAASHDPPEDVLAFALRPPPEALQGLPTRARRLLPGREPTRRWWDIDFFPLRREGQVFAVLGRITLVVGADPGGAPLPEKLMALRQRVAARHGGELLAGSSPALRRLASQVRLAARTDAPVLFVGERGTGKKTLARVVHFLGPHREESFAALDGARLPPALLAVFLFEVRGPQHRLATIYLREPACLPRDLQLRLAEWLSADADPSGEQGRPRLLAGCANDPAEDVRSGRLAEELACCLATLRIDVPPLRQRLADLPNLVERLLERAAAESEGRVTGLSPEAWEVIRSYSWPGNLAELYDVLSTAAARATGDRIALADLPASLRLGQAVERTPARDGQPPLPLRSLLEQAERRLILLALGRVGGNKSKAATLLGIWRPYLLSRMKKLGLLAETEEAAEEGET
jgi:transcriptional regulator with PAS, ATPase and Fis domain